MRCVSCDHGSDDQSIKREKIRSPSPGIELSSPVSRFDSQSRNRWIWARPFLSLPKKKLVKSRGLVTVLSADKIQNGNEDVKWIFF